MWASTSKNPTTERIRRDRRAPNTGLASSKAFVIRTKTRRLLAVLAVLVVRTYTYLPT